MAKLKNYVDVTTCMVTPLVVVPSVERIISNPPATIALWSDGQKTVVKCRECDEYDPVTGTLLCVAKRMFGNGYTAFKRTLFGVAEERTPDDELEYLARRLLRLSEREQRTIHLYAARYRFRPEDFYDAEATVYYNEPKGTGSGEIISAYLKDMDGILDKAKKLERLDREKAIADEVHKMTVEKVKKGEI